MNGQYAPQVRAALLLREGKPAEAAKALSVAKPYQDRVFDILYQRGCVLLAAGDTDGAASAFRYILAHPGLGPGPEYDLSYLGTRADDAPSGAM